MSKLLVSLMLVIGCGTAAADSVTPMFNACIDQSNGVTSAIIACMAPEIKFQDRRLNLAYKTAMSKLTASQAAKLRESQRAWITYRDSSCQFYFNTDGTNALLKANDCVLTKTAVRADELESIE